MDAGESFLDWKNDHNIQLAAAAKSQGNLDKPQTLIAASATLTSQFFYEHFLSVDVAPLDRNVVKGSTVSQDVLGGIFNRKESTNISWWSDN